MLKLYDIQCQNCGNIEEVLVETKNGSIINKLPKCEKCNGPCKRIFSSFNFKLIYDNKTQSCGWGNNGYASNKYWDDVNAQRKQGKDVKPIK